MMLLDFGDESYTYLQVEAIGDASWNVTIYPLDPSVVASWDGSEPLAGVAYDVVLYTGPAGLVDYQFSPDDLIWGAWTWAADGTGYPTAIAAMTTSSGASGTGPLPAGPVYLSVAASSDWSLTLRP